MASEDESANYVLKKKKNVASGNSCEIVGGDERNKTRSLLTGKRVLFEPIQQQNMSSALEGSPENTFSYSKQKMMADKNTPQDKLHVPEVVRMNRVERIKNSYPVLNEHLLKNQIVDFSPAPSDSSSVCSIRSAYSSPRRSITSKRYSSPSCRKRDYKSDTPKPQIKRSFCGKSSDSDDSPKSERRQLRFLGTPDSEPRYTVLKDSQNKSRDSYRRKSFPVSKVSSPTARASTADRTPYRPPDFADQRFKRMRPLLPHYKPWSLVSYKSDVGFIDTHCHLDFLFQRQDYEGTYADYRKSHKDTFPESYEGCVAIFCNPYTFSKKSMWEKYLEEDDVWAAFGCHPHNADVYSDIFEAHLKDALAHPRVVALGEIGVDYSNRNNCKKEKQHEVFRRQLQIAKDKSLPLVIHCRDAHEDCMRILKEVIPKDYYIHLHCFTDTWKWASIWLETFPNLFIGITNVVTFPSAECVHEVAKNIPLNRLLLETDTPYFIPKAVSKNLRWSHPGLAIHVAAQIAVLRDISLDEVLRNVRKNTERMYGI